ncbi:hypothetical protein B0H13DRAFT_2058195, partial [Mycena leptocephala]
CPCPCRFRIRIRGHPSPSLLSSRFMFLMHPTPERTIGLPTGLASGLAAPLATGEERGEALHPIPNAEYPTSAGRGSTKRRMLAIPPFPPPFFTLLFPLSPFTHTPSVRAAFEPPLGDVGVVGVEVGAHVDGASSLGSPKCEPGAMRRCVRSESSRRRSVKKISPLDLQRNAKNQPFNSILHSRAPTGASPSTCA